MRPNDLEDATAGGWRRIARSLAFASLAGLVLATAAPCAQPTGDRAAIGFFTRAVADYASLPGAKTTSKGFFFLHYNGGTSVDYRWGRNPSTGFSPASADVHYWLNNGQIVGYLATISAPKIPRLRVLVVAENVFVSTSRCWEQATASSAPFGIGERPILSDNGGKFLKLAKDGASTVVTYSYLWRKGTRARETATFSNSKPPTIRSKIVLTGDTTITIHQTITPLRAAPALPVSSRPPSSPVPKPIC